MLALIIANGNLDHSAELAALIKQADYLIAVDLGANHCASLGITPDILLGDLDSIKPEILTELESKEIPIHRHPTRKDATDLELAVDLAINKGALTVWLAGGLGGRWDMSLANIMLLASDKYKNQEMFLLDKDCSMQILHPGRMYTINGIPQQRVSFLPLKSEVCNVTLRGFEYPLTLHTISFGSTLGVSNIIKRPQATVQHSEGLLLCVLFNVGSS